MPLRNSGRPSRYGFGYSLFNDTGSISGYIASNFIINREWSIEENVFGRLRGSVFVTVSEVMEEKHSEL